MGSPEPPTQQFSGEVWLCFNNLSFIGLFKQSNSQSCNGFVSFKLLALMKNYCDNYWANKDNRKHNEDAKKLQLEHRKQYCTKPYTKIKHEKKNPWAEEEMGVNEIVPIANDPDSASSNRPFAAGDT